MGLSTGLCPHRDDSRLADNTETKVTVTVTDTGVLVVDVKPELFAAFDESKVVLMGIKLAKERLNIKTEEIKGVLVNVK